MNQLVAIEGLLAGQSFELTDELTIGRSPECTLTLAESGVSRKHACVRCTEEGVLVEDFNSSGGTFVNGQSIRAPKLLHDQDVVVISKQVFRFVTGEPVAQAAGAAGGGAQAAAVAMEEGEVESESQIEGTLDVGATMVGGVFAPSPAVDAAKANERLRTIVQISNAVQTELELNVLLGLILDNLFEVFGQADRGFLMLYDEQGELKPAASRNRYGQTEKITISRSIVNQVTNKRLALLSRDAMGDDRFGAAVSIANFGIRSMMCAPLIAKDDVLGIIHVDTARQERKFTEDDLELLSGVAAQTALAIASAKMHKRLLHQDRMERDLKVATQVQTSFLPAHTPQVEGMEFAAWYKAALDIGGDLYDFIRQSEDSMVVVLGDVSGKGIPAALLMARMSSDVRFYSIQKHDPKDVLPYLNDRMDETGMSHVFVTMVLVTVDLKTHEVLIGNAAHCMPLVRRAAEGDVIEVGGEPGFPLGVMPGFEYTQSAYALQPGDVMCLVSDGVTEAMDAEKNQYGEERLARTVEAAPPSAKGVLDAVLADVKEHVGDTKQSDDLTCVCFGVNLDEGEEEMLEFVPDD